MSASDEGLKFSIIIPIYNVAEGYLRQCLDSVMAQTYTNIEVLLVIDGATDGSPLICREYVTKDNRFFTYEKPNGGAGSARNYAIDRADGNYILFVDCDDYLLDQYFMEKTANLLNESHADILSFGYCEFYNVAEMPTSSTPGALARSEVYGKSASDALSRLLKTSRCNFSSSVVTKCIKSSLIRENNIRFIENINGEDAHYTALLLIYAKSYDRLNEYIYAVRRHSQSISRSATNSHKVANSMQVIFDDLFLRYDLKERGNELILDFLASPYLYALGKLAAAYDADLLNKLSKYKFVLKYSSRVQVKIASTVANLFGLKLLVLSLRIFLTHSKKSHVKITRGLF